MRFVDTNIFLRYLTKDDEVKAAACFEFFQRLQNGTEIATTCEAVVAEVVYVLSSRAHYHLSPEDIRARLRPLLTVRGLKLPQKRLYLRALDLYVAYPFLDFEDAVCAAHMGKQKIGEILSYDTDFDRVSEVVRQEP